MVIYPTLLNFTRKYEGKKKKSNQGYIELSRHYHESKETTGGYLSPWAGGEAASIPLAKTSPCGHTAAPSNLRVAQTASKISLPGPKTRALLLVGAAWRKGDKVLLAVLPPCPSLGTRESHSLGHKALAACKSPKDFCL